MKPRPSLDGVGAHAKKHVLFEDQAVYPDLTRYLDPDSQATFDDYSQQGGNLQQRVDEQYQPHEVVFSACEFVEGEEAKTWDNLTDGEYAIKVDSSPEEAWNMVHTLMDFAGRTRVLAQCEHEANEIHRTKLGDVYTALSSSEAEKRKGEKAKALEVLNTLEQKNEESTEKIDQLEEENELISNEVDELKERLNNEARKNMPPPKPRSQAMEGNLSAESDSEPDDALDKYLSGGRHRSRAHQAGLEDHDEDHRNNSDRPRLRHHASKDRSAREKTTGSGATAFSASTFRNQLHPDPEKSAARTVLNTRRGRHRWRPSYAPPTPSKQRPTDSRTEKTAFDLVIAPGSVQNWTEESLWEELDANFLNWQEEDDAYDAYATLKQNVGESRSSFSIRLNKLAMTAKKSEAEKRRDLPRKLNVAYYNRVAKELVSAKSWAEVISHMRLAERVIGVVKEMNSSATPSSSPGAKDGLLRTDKTTTTTTTRGTANAGATDTRRVTPDKFHRDSLPPLTDALKEKLKKEGRCWRCREHGHQGFEEACIFHKSKGPFRFAKSSSLNAIASEPGNPYEGAAPIPGQLQLPAPESGKANLNA
ncbi:hypothetical protein B0A54_17693 [Friedmanniomyces endolithicus]|uniref:Retrotransposon gag domain-containing protein n=1 Tax=Friedmanniomyces endolithicus TaxID=329885 RepID=A0A4U0TTN9_9PEZI|nr:hypothetical protein B0A54_17693 [Friedmanniomyces endolithicus]